MKRKGVPGKGALFLFEKVYTGIGIEKSIKILYTEKVKVGILCRKDYYVYLWPQQWFLEALLEFVQRL